MSSKNRSAVGYQIDVVNVIILLYLPDHVIRDKLVFATSKFLANVLNFAFRSFCTSMFGNLDISENLPPQGFTIQTKVLDVNIHAHFDCPYV